MKSLRAMQDRMRRANSMGSAYREVARRRPAMIHYLDSLPAGEDVKYLRRLIDYLGGE